MHSCILTCVMKGAPSLGHDLGICQLFHVGSTLFIILTNVYFFLYSKFLPMKVRQRRPMSNAKYRMGTQPCSWRMLCESMEATKRWLKWDVVGFLDRSRSLKLIMFPPRALIVDTTYGPDLMECQKSVANVPWWLLQLKVQ